MSANVDTPAGLTVTFATSAFSTQVTNLTFDGITRPALDTTHMGSTLASGVDIGERTYIPGGFTDGGTVTLEIHYNPDDDPPMQSGDVAETITVQYAASGGDTTGASWAFSGFVTSFSLNAPLDELMTATVVIQVSGAIDITVGA